MAEHPERGLKIDGIPESHLIAGGGPIPTALCTFARLGGGKAALVAPLGDDAWGDVVRRELDRFGVDHNHCIVRRKCPTALAFAWIEQPTSARTIVLDNPPRLYITPDDINTAHLPRPKFLHLDGRHIEAAVKLARWGRRVGAKIMLDVGSVRNRVDDLFPFLDYLVCADQYALHYFGARSVLKALFGFQALGIPEVVITCGTAGAYGLDAGGQPVYQRAFKVRAVDVTGAGDVFHGAYLFGLCRKWDLAYRLKFASAAAALKCRKRGARDGIPTYDETMAFMKNHRAYHA
jgi:ribokinase